MTEKNFLQDVVPPSQKRSIRDIPVPPRKKPLIRKPVLKPEKTEEIKITDTVSPVRPKYQENLEELNGASYEKSQKIKKYLKIFVVLVCVVLLFVLFSNLDSAKVTISPKIVEAVINKEISIGDSSKEIAAETLGYKVINLDKEVSKVVESDSEEFIQSKATGVITIYNEYSDKTQNLIKNTRFESPQGLIYTIKNNVAVPGYKMVNGEKKAGTLDVEVTAAAAGENYNIGLTEFTVPGFKGQEPYDFFYAKSKTEMTGGFDGVKKLVSTEKKTQATVELKQNVRDALIADLKSQVSKEYVFLLDDNSFTFGQVTESQEQNSNNVTLKIKGTIAAKIFDKIDLSNALASGSIIEYSDDQNVLVKDIENVDLSISDNKIIANSPMTFVWQIDTEELKQLFLNKKKSEFGGLIKDQPSIDKGSLIIKPFWKTRFPENAKDIEIELVSN